MKMQYRAAGSGLQTRTEFSKEQERIQAISGISNPGKCNKKKFAIHSSHQGLAPSAQKIALEILRGEEMRQGDQPKTTSRAQPEGRILLIISGVLNFSCRRWLQTLTAGEKLASGLPTGQSQTSLDLVNKQNTLQTAFPLSTLNWGFSGLNLFYYLGFPKKFHWEALLVLVNLQPSVSLLLPGTFYKPRQSSLSWAE